MKASAQIIGLPIISIADGMQIGAVKSFVINPDKGSIDFLTVEQEDVQLSLKAIPFKKSSESANSPLRWQAAMMSLIWRKFRLPTSLSTSKSASKIQKPSRAKDSFWGKSMSFS